MTSPSIFYLKSTKFISYMKYMTHIDLMNSPKIQTGKITNDVHVLSSYVWTLINIEMLSLDNKRPIFYIIFRYIQHFIFM